MNRTITRTALTLALCSTATVLVAGTAAGARQSGSTTLADVRRATAKYHDVSAALADGYLPTEHCVADAPGSMGMHYVHPGRMQSVDPLRPAILLYLPGEDGPRLAGVEYWQADTGQLRPSALGHLFDGPMAGHEPGMPQHYDLHVWLWAHNPAGTYSAFNPAVSCEV
jgi:hypothetical protein